MVNHNNLLPNRSATERRAGMVFGIPNPSHSYIVIPIPTAEIYTLWNLFPSPHYSRKLKFHFIPIVKPYFFDISTPREIIPIPTPMEMCFFILHSHGNPVGNPIPVQTSSEDRRERLDPLHCQTIAGLAEHDRPMCLSVGLHYRLWTYGMNPACMRAQYKIIRRVSTSP